MAGPDPEGREGRSVDADQTVATPEALRHSVARYVALLAHATEMMAIVDDAGVIRYVSPAVEPVLGYRAAELIGRRAPELYHPDEREHRESILAEVAAKAGRVRRGELRFRHRDGAWRLLDCTWTNAIADPAVGGIIVNSRDVTQERSLAEQLRHAQKMEAVGRLAGGVAHDFNNILTAIRGYTLMVLEEVGDAALRADLEEVVRAADRAADLVRRLLTFSRKQTARPQRLDATDLVRDLERMLKRLVGADVMIETSFADAPLPVHADRGLLEQVLVNLVVNARDAMPEGGRIHIRADGVDREDTTAARLPSGAHAAGYIRLSVSDTGVGMPASVRERIFEPFFTTKEKGKGTGLGLSTVYQIVKQAGGHVWVYSEPGAGTTFKIYLPRDTDIRPAAPDEGDDAGDATAPLPLPDFADRLVLLVDDDASVRTFARRAMEAAGVHVVEAENGEDALRIVESHAGVFDLVVTDILMPLMGGPELARRLAVLRPTTPVLFTSGQTSEEVAERGVLPPGARLIEKPFTPRTLVERVAGALRSTGATDGDRTEADRA